tara:strand:+ start:1551 stop:1760 length:210 start_codon:yes stop_codon:yes gene_type:complete
MTTHQHWKRLFEKQKENPEIKQKFFTIKRNSTGKLIEVFYVYRLKDHLNETIYSFKEIIDVMEKEKSNV